jgi:hypothetical protein
MKIIYLIYVTLFFFVTLLIFPSQSDAVYIASDSVTIFEDGDRLTDDSVIFVANYGTHSEKCNRGICEVGQQFYPIRVYKSKEGSTLLNFSEFSSQNPFNGDDNDGTAKDNWNNDIKQGYLNYLDENSIYSTSFNPGLSEGVTGCGYPGCIGGRVGNPRSYNLDIVNGDSEMGWNMKIWIQNLPLQYILIPSIFITLVLIVLIFFIKKQDRSNKVYSNKKRLPKN